MKLAALTLLLTVGAVQSVNAQARTADPVARGISLSEFPRIVKLADNVYGYEEIRQPGFTTVSLFVVGRNGVLIADGQGKSGRDPDHARQDSDGDAAPRALVCRRLRPRRSHRGEFGPSERRSVCRAPDVARPARSRFNSRSLVRRAGRTAAARCRCPSQTDDQ